MLLYFTILKTHFIIIPSYFTIFPHPKTLFLLKYYFLIFLYYFFIIVNFFKTHISQAFQQSFFFPLLLPQPLATHKPSTSTAMAAPKTQATDQLKPPINPSTTTATAPKTHQHLNPSTTTITAMAPKTHQPMLPI